MHASSLFALLFSRRAAARSCWLSLFARVCGCETWHRAAVCLWSGEYVCAVCGAGVWEHSLDFYFFTAGKSH